MGGRGVIEGAFALLEALAHGDEMGLTHLALAAGLPKATAYRLLSQLVAEGAVQRRAGRYQLGPRVFRLGQTWQPARLLRAAAAQPMRQLTGSSERCGFCLAVTDRGHTMIIGGIGREIDEIFPLRAGMLLPPGTATEKALSGATGGELAYDTDGSRLGLYCVAAPVHGPSGEVVAALAATTLEPQRLTVMAEPVKRAAALVATNLVRLMRAGRSSL
ncbi:helix-turn-helix domain-containing protein [Nocardia sp. NPDC052566]|uniref:helix-turn-helix domain-containing protein n=1 Tax=Nocardia sp. NPDC052566 TaxID=3364330 RepID=UPI0037C63768